PAVKRRGAVGEAGSWNERCGGPLEPMRRAVHETWSLFQKAAPHPEAPFAARKRPRRMLQEASNGALWNVLRGRFAAPQDEGTGFWVRLLVVAVPWLSHPLAPARFGLPRTLDREQHGKFAAQRRSAHC